MGNGIWEMGKVRKGQKGKERKGKEHEGRKSGEMQAICFYVETLNRLVRDDLGGA